MKKIILSLGKGNYKKANLIEIKEIADINRKNISATAWRSTAEKDRRKFVGIFYDEYVFPAMIQVCNGKVFLLVDEKGDAAFVKYGKINGKKWLIELVHIIEPITIENDTDLIYYKDFETTEKIDIISIFRTSDG